MKLPDVGTEQVTFAPIVTGSVKLLIVTVPADWLIVPKLVEVPVICDVMLLTVQPEAGVTVTICDVPWL